MSNRCLWCKKDIDNLDSAIPIGIEGDMVCSMECGEELMKEMEAISKMSEEEFAEWVEMNAIRGIDDDPDIIT